VDFNAMRPEGYATDYSSYNKKAILTIFKKKHK
jgi:hypothetical protein